MNAVRQNRGASSADALEHLAGKALPGIPLTHVPAPPGPIPVKLQYQYFSLSQTGATWEAVLRSRNVAAQLELVILLPEGMQGSTVAFSA